MRAALRQAEGEDISPETLQGDGGGHGEPEQTKGRSATQLP
jgi:hypothetical protein